VGGPRRQRASVDLIESPKKNLFDKKRSQHRLILIFQKPSSVGVGTFPDGGLPWFQRACPSTTLDKNFLFNCKAPL
jgi:hypothetical protein